MTSVHLEANIRQKGYAHRSSIGKKVVDDKDDDPDFVAHATVPEEEAAGGKRKRSKKSFIPNKHRKLSEEHQLGKSSVRNKLESPEESEVPNPLPMLLKLHGSEFFADDVPRIGKRGSGQSTKVKLITPFVDLDATESESEGEPRARRGINALGYIIPVDDDATEPESDADQPKPRQPSDSTNRAASPATECSETEPEEDSDANIHPSRLDESRETVHMEDEEDEDEGEGNALDGEIEYCPHYGPKPCFPAATAPPLCGPLVLDASKGVQVPSSVNRYLREYQREGVHFFWDRYKEGRGGVLGDDMGLGKTIQVIAFLTAIMKKCADKRDKNRRGRRAKELAFRGHDMKDGTWPKANAEWPTCLIITPPTLLDNWQRELRTWGHFEVGKYSGSKTEMKGAILTDFRYGRLDIVLVGIETARDRIRELEELDWSVIFVDEAHRLKNRKSSTYKALNKFACKARFGLTGTAVQNDYREMWPLLDWSNMGGVGTFAQWETYVVTPLKVGQSRDASKEEQYTGRLIAQRLVQDLLPHFFLRRTKGLIAQQMPKKYDHVVFCPLTPKQINVYKAFLAVKELYNILHKDDDCGCGSGKRRKECCYQGQSSPGIVLKYMDIFLKISNHLMLLCPGPGDDAEQLARNIELAKIAFPNRKVTFDIALMDFEMCGKWKVLSELLRTWHEEDENNKVLLFSKSVKLLRALEWCLQYEGYNFEFMSGKVAPADRQPMVDRFNDDPEKYIFLISTMTGGVGLNLTSANRVVIFDPNWNPAHDLQAMDRAYRYGQQRDVHVYRLLGAGSLEELIYARQLYKQQQMRIAYEASLQTRYFSAVQGDKTRQGELFGIKNIFKLNEAELRTKHAVERAQLDEKLWSDSLSAEGMSNLAEFFEEDKIPVKKEIDDPIMDILQSNGVQYVHMNDEILEPSKAEKMVLENFKKKVKHKQRGRNSKIYGEGGSEADEDGPTWPPRRPKKFRAPA